MNSTSQPQFSSSSPNTNLPQPLETPRSCTLQFLRTEICSRSRHPSDAMSWVRDVAVAQTTDDLKTSPSIAGNNHSNFKMLDAKVARALKRILTNTNFKQKLFLRGQKAPKTDRILGGRQIGYTNYEYSNESILDFSELMNVTLRGDDGQGFDTKWVEVLLLERNRLERVNQEAALA